jgi:hypothetical protein
MKPPVNCKWVFAIFPKTKHFSHASLWHTWVILPVCFWYSPCATINHTGDINFFPCVNQMHRERTEYKGVRVLYLGYPVMT